MPHTSRPFLLELDKITKAYPGVVANDEIDLKLMPGEIHALLGENGAGKSTLVKIIYGIVQADSGTIKIDGDIVQMDKPATARAKGVAMVFQHFSLFESLTVVENIALGLESQQNLNSLAEEVRRVSAEYGLPLDPEREVGSLSVGERQRIEIVRCLLQKPRLLIMDEPTSVLTPQEVSRLFKTLRQLASEGMTILYISHKLGEIIELCEFATILRDGKKIKATPVANQTAKSLAAFMMGHEVQQLEMPLVVLGNARLTVKNLNQAPEDILGIRLKDISFSVHGGEVLGIAGVAGNGQEELHRALDGQRKNTRNSIVIDGEPCGDHGVNVRRMLGVASVPEKRLGQGSVPKLNLISNTLLTAYDRLGLAMKGLIKGGKTQAITTDIIDKFKVKTVGLNAEAASLSGGNLQRYIMGRELALKPEVLIVSQPTWGVDAGAAYHIQQSIRALASGGAAVVVISQDLDELMQLSDRIAAICAGSLSEIVNTNDTSVEAVGLMMAGVAT